MDKLNPSYDKPAELYVEELRSTGNFTEEDLLELKDHFLLSYDDARADGQLPLLASDQAKERIGMSSDLIESYARKNEGRNIKELLYFSMFGFASIIFILMPLGYFLLSLPQLLGYIIPSQHPIFSIQYNFLLVLLFSLQISASLALYYFRKKSSLFRKVSAGVNFKKWKVHLLLLIPVGMVASVAIFSRYFYNFPPENISLLGALSSQFLEAFLRLTTFTSCFFLLFWLLKYIKQSFYNNAPTDRWALRFAAFYALPSIFLLLSNSIQFGWVLSFLGPVFALMTFFFLPHALKEIWVKKKYLA